MLLEPRNGSSVSLVLNFRISPIGIKKKNCSAFFTKSNFKLTLAVSYWFWKFKILYQALLSIFTQILVRVNVSMGLLPPTPQATVFWKNSYPPCTLVLMIF